MRIFFRRTQWGIHLLIIPDPEAASHAYLPSQTGLGCGATPEVICAQLAALKDAALVMLVGHQPDLGELIAHLLAASPGSINVRKASLTFVEVLVPRKGGGRLEFSMPARTM